MVLNILKTVLVAGMILGFTAAAAREDTRGTSSPEEELKTPSISWPEPRVDTFTLDNKITFYLIRDNTLPLVHIRVMVRAGGFLEPKDKTGLAEITAEVMRTGGTQKYPHDELNALLADRAAEISMDFDFISGSAKMEILSSDLSQLLPVFVDLLKQPAFPEDKITLAKQQLTTRISRRNDRQAGIARRTFEQLIYGQDSIFAREPEYETVAKINRADLLRFHKRAYQGANLIVGIAGDFDPDNIHSLLKKEFSAFAAGEKTDITLPSVDVQKQTSLYVVNKSDVNQSYIMVGHLGGRRMNPDYPALQVMNQILGGGFSGRLFQTIRTRMGLAYSVSGSYDSRFFYPGTFHIALTTKTPASRKAVKAVRNEVRNLQEEITAKEVKRAKARFLNSAAFYYDQAEKILERRLHYAYRGMPQDTLQELIQKIEQVTAPQVVQAARKYLLPEALTILTVGNQKQLEKQLQAFGTVAVLPQP
ncbi:MAG: pitrilysin family protein [Desulfotignum sp.]